MNVTRSVILDLLPLYAAGEVSADTRALVDEYLKGDAELAASVRSGDLASMAATGPVAGPGEEAEMRSLRRTRSLLRWQRRLYAWALTFTFLSLSSVFHFEQGHLQFHFLLRDYPAAMGGLASLAVTCWINYFLFRWRLRGTKL